MKKNSKGLYLNTKKDINTNNLYFERNEYRIHLCGIEDEARGLDRFLFAIANELGYKDFKKQFNEIVNHSLLLDLPIFTFYKKEDEQKSN